MVKKKKCTCQVCVCVQVEHTGIDKSRSTLNAHKTKGEYPFFPASAVVALVFPSRSWSGVAHANATHTLTHSLVHTHTQTTRPHKCRSLSIKTHQGPEGETDTSVRPRPKEDTRHDTWSKILRAAFVFITHASSYWFPLNPLPSYSTVFPFDAYLKRFLRFHGARCPFRSSFRRLAVQIWLVPVQCLQMSKTFGTQAMTQLFLNIGRH